MDINDAVKDLLSKHPSVDASQLRAMLEDEITWNVGRSTHDKARLKGRNKYAIAVTEAHHCIDAWLSDPDVYLSNLLDLLAFHRRAYCWAVLAKLGNAGLVANLAAQELLKTT